MSHSVTIFFIIIRFELIHKITTLSVPKQIPTFVVTMLIMETAKAVFFYQDLFLTLYNKAGSFIGRLNAVHTIDFKPMNLKG